MKSNTVVILDNRYEHYNTEKKIFSEMGIEPKVCFPKNDEDAISVLKDADAILCNLFNLHAGIISKLEKCKVISRYGVGYDNVDTELATKRGIVVCNVPDYATEDASDHALALFLDCVRKVSYRDRKVREGAWNLHNQQPCYRISGKTFGILGFGKTGRALARKISCLGLARILVCTPHYCDNDSSGLGVEFVDFERLLKESDYISIHCPLKEETKKLFNTKSFSKMKEGAMLINTARGGILDQDDLYNALLKGLIAFAAIDVYEEEPLPIHSKLRTLENITMTDHAAWYSEESLIELKTKATNNVIKILKGEDAINQVN